MRSPRLSARPALRPPPRPWVAPRRYAVRSAAPRPSCVYSGAPRCVCLSTGCSGRRSREYALHCGLRTRTDLRNAPATSADPYPRPSRVPSFVPSFVRLPPSVLRSSASGLRASLRPALLLPAAAASGYGRADGAAPALRGAAVWGAGGVPRNTHRGRPRAFRARCARVPRSLRAPRGAPRAAQTAAGGMSIGLPIGKMVGRDQGTIRKQKKQPMDFSSIGRFPQHIIITNLLLFGFDLERIVSAGL